MRSWVCWVVFVLAVALTGSSQWVLWTQDFESEPLSNLNNVKNTVSWYIVDRAWFYSEPAEIQAFPSGSRALYFGKIVQGRGTYDGVANISYAQPVFGVITQPSGLFQLDNNCWVRVSFKYVREVEYWPWGHYDETQAMLDGVPIFNQSSKDPSEKKWTSFVSDAFKPASFVPLYFIFNPKDTSSNDFFGWLIDDIKVEAVVVINTDSLPDAMVGTYYTCVLNAEGGVKKGGKYKWKVEGLPEGLQLRDGEIKGTPTKAGVYQVKVTVTDYASEASGGRYPDSSFTRTYTLVVNPTSEASHTRFSENFENGNGPDIPGWTRTGLWHRTSANVISDQFSAYYGKDDKLDYDTGARTYGELTSPKWNVADRRGQEVRISFWHIREVENNAEGFDKTYVEIRFDEGPWQQVWYRDSKDQPNYYEPVVISTFGDSGQPIVIPATASTMQIRFVFDSVDGLYNNFLGWVIDNIVVELKAGELKITTTTLPSGQVGVYYETWLEARGGTPPYAWTLEGRPPAGLRLERNGKLCGYPEETGEFTIRVKVTDNENITDEKELTLNIGRKTLLFCDNFGEGLAKWTAEGLWHRTEQVKGVNLANYGYVAYYGKDDLTSPNYATGARTVGYLTSQEFPIESGVTAFKLVFDYWREVEFYAPGGYDKTYVEVRFLTGADWTQWYRIWYKDSAHPSEKAWAQAAVGPYTLPAGATKMQIRFVFDSVDRFYNNYVGWLIDNVKVEMASSGSPLPTTSLEPMTKPRGDFAVFNIPNPVRDVHTTTFVVRGVEADLIRVEVYDLTGRLVYAGEAPGNELVWHTQDLLGRYLANGVYLYKVLVKVGDTWIVSDVQKIVILR